MLFQKPPARPRPNSSISTNMKTGSDTPAVLDRTQQPARLKRCGYPDLDGARGRNRTTDTAIFSRMLYQLSYPGIGAIHRRRVDSPAIARDQAANLPSPGNLSNFTDTRPKLRTHDLPATRPEARSAKTQGAPSIIISATPAWPAPVPETSACAGWEPFSGQSQRSQPAHCRADARRSPHAPPPRT